MTWKRFFVYTLITLALILGIIFIRTSPNQSAIKDFMDHSDTSKPSLLLTLYNRGLVRNVYALNTILAIEDLHVLLLKGMGLDRDAQTLANPFVRYVKVTEGMRKEEIANRVGSTLNWTNSEKNSFNQLAINDEGKLYPETYLIPNNIAPVDFKNRMLDRFNDEVVNSKAMINKTNINLDTTLKIASIIQREAAGKNDMNLISGIIWNRIFDGMNLDIDATLQYAKGNNTNGWWPQVTPADKKIASPYNTYKNNGLPPSPISNPGLAAILAALKPQKTSCLFYFHDNNHQIHCSATYQEHVAKIKRFL